MLKIKNEQCMFITPDENRCSDEHGGVIWYFKAIRAYEDVRENPKYQGDTNGQN
jgi:hypothetical protein